MTGSSLGEALIVEAEKLNVVQKEFFGLEDGVKEEYLHKFYAYRYEEFLEKGVVKRNEDYNVRQIHPRQSPMTLLEEKDSYILMSVASER